MTPPPRPSGEEIRRGVERLKPWFHRVDLGDGLRTKAASVAGEADDHPLPTWDLVRRVLPESLAGKSVLDVGCNAGFYSFEAARRGAERVLGVDAQRHQVRQALFCRRVLGLGVTEFRRLSVYDLSRETVGSFDVVLALGLLYHLKHLVLALERLFEVTGELLIVETAVLPPAHVPDVPFPIEVGGRGLLHHPVGYVENRSDAKEAVYNWFLPSPEATRAMLAAVGFTDVRVEFVTSDRAVLSAKRPARPAVSVLAQLACRVEPVEVASEVSPDEPVALGLRVVNTGKAEIPASLARVGAHLLRGDEEVDWEWLSASLPASLSPGESGLVTLRGLPPEEPGRYEVEVDLVLENLTWMEDLGSPPLRFPLRVGDGAGPLWYRALGLREELDVELDAVTSRRFSGRRFSSRLLDALEERRGSRGDGDLPQLLARALLGYLPGDEAESDWKGQAEGGGLRGLARRLLLAPDGRRPPEPPPAGRLERLRGRREKAGAGDDAALPTLSGESFPGEAALAADLLRHLRSVDDGTFVREAYRAVLGREPDPGALEGATRRLLGRETSRAFLLRDLLWSEELRTG